MNNKEYLEYLITSYISKNHTTEGLKEYLIELSKNIEENKVTNETSTMQGKSNQKKIGTGKVTGGLNMYPEHTENNTFFNQQGVINILTLSLLVFFFQVIFIVLSLYIY